MFTSTSLRHPWSFDRKYFLRSNRLFHVKYKCWRHKDMWPINVFSFRIPWKSLNFWIQQFPCNFMSNKLPWNFLLMIAPWLRFRNFPFFLSFIFPYNFFQQTAKKSILQPHLRTRRCVGFWISSHPAFGCLRGFSCPQTFGCMRTFRGWRTCRNMRSQVHCRFRFRHIFWCSLSTGILSATKRAEMADVKQEKKSTRRHFDHKEFHTWWVEQIPFNQNVCELMFGVQRNAFDLRVQIDTVKQPIQRNSVGSWNMFHCATPTFASFSSKTYNMALEQEGFMFDETLSILARSTLMCLVGIWLRMVGGVLCKVSLQLSEISLAFVGLVWENKKLQSPDPINQARESRPTSIRRPKRWFRILMNCVKLKSVSCTSNFLAQTCTSENAQCSNWCRFWILKIANSPQSRQLSLSLGMNPICIVVLYFPHDNIVWVHEIKRAKSLSQKFVHFFQARASLFTDRKISSLPIRA